MLMYVHLLPMLLYVIGEGDPVDVSGVVTALQGTITASQVAGLIAAIVGAGATIYLTWVFGRKAIRMFFKAVNGRSPA